VVRQAWRTPRGYWLSVLSLPVHTPSLWVSVAIRSQCSNLESILASSEFLNLARPLGLISKGANLTVNCWGPALGAKVVPYRTALVLGLICQSLGLIVFGPEGYPVFGGFIDQRSKFATYPRLTMYSLMWIVATPVIWQALAVWQRTIVPPYLGVGV